MGKPLVIASKVTKSFLHMGRSLEVLRGIDLTIDEGELVGIVGQSGAGKSTFLHCIGTLDVITSGSLRLGSEELGSMSSSRLAGLRNRMVGFVFQFHHLLPEFNALENVMMPGLIQGQPRKEIEKAATELLAEVGLDKRATHRPGELSGGEQQRVALARALVLKPKVLLLDEPTSALDPKRKVEIAALFREQAEAGTTVIAVTHDEGLSNAAHARYTMAAGKLTDA